MKTKTELLLDYVQLSWNFDFPPRIEAALEEDYVMNHRLYTENTIKLVALLLLIDPDASANQAIEIVRSAIER